MFRWNRECAQYAFIQLAAALGPKWPLYPRDLLRCARPAPAPPVGPLLRQAPREELRSGGNERNKAHGEDLSRRAAVSIRLQIPADFSKKPKWKMQKASSKCNHQKQNIKLR